MPAIDNIFAKARAAHQSGRIADAEAGYLEVLKKLPQHLEALTLLGAIELQSARPESAERRFARALAISPASHVIHSNRSLALRALKRLPDALASCERGLALRPDYHIALYNRALILQDLGRHDEALAGYERVLAAVPRHAQALANRGAIFQEMGRYDEALSDFTRALALEPQNAEMHNNLAAALKHLGRFEDALASYERAIALQPDYAVAHYNRGIVLQDLKRAQDAFESYSRALALKPDYAEAYNNRGLMLRDMRRNLEALADFDQALAFSPNYVEGLNNRGAILQELHRNDEAMADFSRMLELQGDNDKAYNNRGHALRGLGRYEEALASYDQATTLNPKYAEAHFNASLCRLLLGDMEKGWQQYEWRWHGRERRRFSVPLWLGDQPLAGKTILLHAEQGFGDTIQIVRYIAPVAALGAKVILQVQAPLVPLLAHLPDAESVIATDADVSGFDYHCPLMSLPLAFKTTHDTLPRPTGYITPDDRRVRDWQVKLPKKRRLRIGLVWSGSGEYVNDYNRSVLLSDLETLLSLPFDFICLQKEIRDHDREALAKRSDLRFLGDELTTFAETAALAQCMDLVISVDTAVAHLAAALGRPTWVLLKYEPDWRWLLDRKDSLWYPTATLFRQKKAGDWGSVIDEIVGALTAEYSK